MVPSTAQFVLGHLASFAEVVCFHAKVPDIAFRRPPLKTSSLSSPEKTPVCIDGNEEIRQARTVSIRCFL